MIEYKTVNHALEALDEKNFFKLVCGASLTDTEMIEKLSFVFTLAGAHVIDLAPASNVILAARNGISRAFTFAPSHLRTQAPLLMASIQLDKDPHFRKVKVDYDTCDVCGVCVKVCPTEAFGIENSKFSYNIERCFGCNICPSYCHVSALSMVDTFPTPKETLNEMIKLGVDAIEFHFGSNAEKIIEIWEDIKSSVKDLKLLSFSIGSDLLSEAEIRKAANLCYRLAGKGIILQCDGTPMSGALKKNGNNTDKSSLNVIKIISEEKLPVYLQMSGGTNQNSYLKAAQENIPVSGVAMGSYARKLLMPYLNKLDDKEQLEKAIFTARSLVESVGIKYETKK